VDDRRRPHAHAVRPPRRRLPDVNAGSVGAAWERSPAAYWALIADDEIELRSTEYDVDAALAALAPDHPRRELREQWIRGPHDPVAIAREIEEALGRLGG
jgi:hypothetical protein